MNLTNISITEHSAVGNADSQISWLSLKKYIKPGIYQAYST